MFSLQQKQSYASPPALGNLFSMLGCPPVIRACQGSKHTNPEHRSGITSRWSDVPLHFTSKGWGFHKYLTLQLFPIQCPRVRYLQARLFTYPTHPKQEMAVQPGTLSSPVAMLNNHLRPSAPRGSPKTNNGSPVNQHKKQCRFTSPAFLPHVFAGKSIRTNTLYPPIPPIRPKGSQPYTKFSR